MTLSPVDNYHAVKPRPDLPAYELNTVDPISGEPATEDHHIFRRSLGPGFRDAWWVELEDGTVIPNRVALSHETHRKVTDNKIHILYRNGWWSAIFVGRGLSGPLAPQPGPQAVVHDGKSFDRRLTINGREVPHGVVCAEGEEPCPTCKGRGKRPKREHKPAAARKKAVKSIRVPKDEQENGLEVLDGLIDAHRVRLAPQMGWSESVADYYVIVAALAEGLQ